MRPLRASLRSAALGLSIAFVSACGTQARGRGAEPVATTTRAPAPESIAARAEAESPAPNAADDAPACAEIAGGAWPRAEAFVAVRAGSEGALGALVQPRDGREAHLRFLGAHLFDLLGKIDREAGPSERSERELVCAALNDVAARGAPVVRLWGSLKRTGDDREIARTARLLALVLDENARRARPLRFVVALLNHQAGWGAPDPSRALDEQDPATGWDAKTVYLRDGWRAEGRGMLEARVRALAATAEVKGSPYVLAWELVNELDAHRLVQRGVLGGKEAARLRDGFAVPALSMLARALPQPVALGDLRAELSGYAAFSRSLVDALPRDVRERLVWVSHVYVDRDASAKAARAETRKLDLDLAIAASRGLPLLLGEIGQRAPGETAGLCGEGPAHDVPALFRVVLDDAAHPLRTSIDTALFWGEGACDLALPSGARVVVGAGGDSADLAPGDRASRDALRKARGEARFTTAW